jgi:hypothetical protein
MCDICVPVAFRAVMFHQEKFWNCAKQLCWSVALGEHFIWGALRVSRFLCCNNRQFSFFSDKEE